MAINHDVPPAEAEPDPVEREDLGNVDLDDLWTEVQAEHRASGLPRRQAEFLFHLGRMITEPDRITEVAFCSGCYGPTMRNDMRDATRGRRICQDCVDNGWYYCSECNLYDPDTESVEEDYYACSGCLDASFTFCDYCDHYYRTEHGGHNHSRERSGYCMCDVPTETVAVPYLGGLLQEDTRVNVALAEGVISDVGLAEIKQLISTHLNEVGLPYDYNSNDDVQRVIAEQQPWRDMLGRIDDLGAEWSNAEGTYTKRLSRFAYKGWKLKVPADVVTQVGNIASAHSRAVDFNIEVTRQLNLGPEMFAHSGSCWWQSYTPSRCTFKSNGGFALRSFLGTEGTNDEYPRGRAWVMPLKLNDRGALVPTFNTETPAAFVVFNGYGDLGEMSAPRIMGHLTGWPYRRIEFEAAPMYINAGGFLVAPESTMSLVGDSLRLSVSEHSNLFAQENTQSEEHSHAVAV